MSSILKIMHSLEGDDAKRRVVDWVMVKLGLTAVSTKKVQLHSAAAENDRDSGVEPILREGTVNTVVAKLGAKTCRTLLVAAAAYITLYQGKEKFTRDELLSCARSARLWKADYSTQVSININRMCESDELIEKGKDVYDLSQSKLSELTIKLKD